MPQYAFQKSSRPGGRRRRDPRNDLPPSPPSPWVVLAGFIGLCLLVGLAGATVTLPAVHGWYAALAKPPLTPPDWVFGPVWTTLYLMIGAAGWLVWWKAPVGRRQGAALQLWGWQLLLNAAWSPAFFGMHNPALGLMVIFPLILLVGMTIVSFWRLVRSAALLLLPYAAWSCFAAYLNLGFWWLNR